MLVTECILSRVKSKFEDFHGKITNWFDLVGEVYEAAVLPATYIVLKKG